MRLVLAVLLAVNTLNIYDRVALSALVEPVRREFHLTDAQIGLLTTLFTAVYALAGIPLGRLADTRSRRKLLAAGVAVWASLTAAAGLAGSYAVLLATRLGVGIGEAVCAPAGVSWIGDLVPSGRRARALAVFMLATPLGSMLGPAVGGPVAQAWGWRAALIVAALPALLLVPALLLLPEAGRAPATARDTDPPWALLRIPAFRWIVLSGALLNFNLYALSAFLPAYMSRCHGWSLARAGLWTGLAIGAAGVAGGLLSAAFGDRAALHHPGGRMYMAAFAAAASAPAVCCGLLARAGSEAALPLLATGNGLLVMYYGLVYAAIQDIVEPRRRGTAMSVYFLAMYLCGGAFGPLAVGRLSDWLARRDLLAGAAAEAARAAGLHGALYLVPAVSLVLAAVLWAGARSGNSGFRN